MFGLAANTVDIVNTIVKHECEYHKKEHIEHNDINPINILSTQMRVLRFSLIRTSVALDRFVHRFVLTREYTV